MPRSAVTKPLALSTDQPATDQPATESAPVPAPRARRTSRAAKAAAAPVALGSLTQNGAREGISCQTCGSERVTWLSMTLTDGTPVRFMSCHRCEERSWLDLDGSALPVGQVLDMTRKPR
jgi:DNA-directed RNA polymerase subunit M/transcription elongation factor TFIIS